jgi:transmembrane sensor
MLEFSESLIIKYLDNNCSEEEERQLLEWLKDSEENAVAFLTIKKIYNLRKVKHYSNEQLLNSAFLKFEERMDSAPKRQKHFSVVAYTKYAAVFLVAVLASVLFWFYFQESSVELKTITVGAHDPVRIAILPDGSKVWVNKESSLTYPVSFSNKERNVSLVGQAYFEVMHDARHPFLVKSEAISVRVLGTSFDVNTKTSDNSIETTLVNGKVSIEDKIGKEMLQLSPGQLARYDLRTKAITVDKVNTDLYTSWRNGLIIFRKATLSEITKKIENFYHVKITINSKKPIYNRYNFVFRQTQSLDTVMQMLKFVAPITYKKYDKQVYINIK